MGIVRSAPMPTLHGNCKSMFHYTTDGEVVIERENDVTQIIEANKFRQSEQSFRHEGEMFNHVAQIDYLAIKNWMAQRGLTKRWWREFNEDPALMRDFLNDPDNKLWRTRLGKV